MYKINLKDISVINQYYKIDMYDYNKTFIIKRLENEIKFYDYIEANKIKYTGESIYLAKQKTGFGYKTFFICPYCGERRQTLYLDPETKQLMCRCCTDANVYKRRTNLYDEGGTDIIDYKMIKLAKSVNIKLKYPFKAKDYIYNKPKYVRYEKYLKVIRQLIVLEQLRTDAIFFKARYSTKRINELLDYAAKHKDFREIYNLTSDLYDKDYIPLNQRFKIMSFK